jgi:CubicO group peptidase (beta-lactamase class C family)
MTMTSSLEVTADPAALGFDAIRLQHVDAFLDRYVAAGRLKGWQLAITRRGDVVHATSSGRADAEAGQAVADDTIWRLYSMTKPITAVTALAAWERGDFQLTDPVSAYIPSFADLRVWRGGSLTRPATEGVTEPMRVWHLFTHMSGLTYGFLNAHTVDGLYRAGGFEWATPPDLDLAGVCDRLATYPLLFQPGTEWNYGYSNDVLGRVVEVAAGRPFADIVQDTVLDPLGMTETGWFVPEAKHDRLAALYVPMPGSGPGSGAAIRYDALGDFAKAPPKAAMGGQGLCGTTGDYLRFMAMLAGGGELDGVRIVAPHTIDYMASNHLPGGQDLAQFGRPLFAETTFDGVGFGLGVSVVTDPVKSKAAYSVGEFGWGGAASTTFWIDPVYDITAIFMTQLMPSDTLPIRPQLRQLIKAALVAP